MRLTFIFNTNFQIDLYNNYFIIILKEKLQNAVKLYIMKNNILSLESFYLIVFYRFKIRTQSKRDIIS